MTQSPRGERELKGTSKNTQYDLSLSFPRKRESIKIIYMDYPIKSGNDIQMKPQKIKLVILRLDRRIH